MPEMPVQQLPVHPVTPPQVQAVLDHAPVGVLIADRASTILYANHSLHRMLGHPPGSLTGTPLAALLPQGLGAEHGGLVESFLDAPRQRQMGTGKPLYARHADGHPVTVEIALCPVDFDGQSAAMAYVSDVSGIRLAQMQFGQVVAAMPQGVLLVDDGGIIRLSNPVAEQLFGYDSGALIGQPLEILIPACYRGAHRGLMAAYAADATPRMMGQGRDLTGLHRSGEEFPVEIALSRLDTPAGMRLLAIINDISARKRAESALRQTNAQLEEFTYVASHDLRSPLRGIADLLGWIREDLGDLTLPEPVTVNFDRIALRVERAERMIDDLLEYARAGQRTLRQEEVDPATLIDDVLALAAVPDTVRVELDITATPLTTWRTPLAASLRNLITNAVKHGKPDHGHIRISARDEGRYVVFSVDDDGPGIPETARERIFRLFHRATATVPGHGVGLAVTRRLINAHDGMISVTGHGALGGACFTVHWPRFSLRPAPEGDLP
ncbi:PAS domain-containing sensor histidine kinase [Novispirillum itersonii]|uniref:histidine kinase n=1 Tax=Novispirillum itersonii TaxID=189 RepID=A0A7X0DKA5_NOVIT|nr:PAS domain-containing sensor histidine kinase [Novispirillum itersonii]MBB6208755.1 PAS domain S-box-containing protein [Novispirillum itersonii]